MTKHILCMLNIPEKYTKNVFHATRDGLPATESSRELSKLVSNLCKVLSSVQYQTHNQQVKQWLYYVYIAYYVCIATTILQFSFYKALNVWHSFSRKECLLANIGDINGDNTIILKIIIAILFSYKYCYNHELICRYIILHIMLIYFNGFWKNIHMILPSKYSLHESNGRLMINIIFVFIM